MGMNDYQRWSRSTAIYPADRAVEYTVLGLVSEAGEVAGKVKKIIRDGDESGDLHAAVFGELGDVLWYLARVTDEMGFDLQDVMDHNQEKLDSRKDRGVLSGSGDNR